MNVKKFTPIILFCLALGYVGFAVFGDDSFTQMKSLETSLAQQQEKNRESHKEIESVKKEVFYLQNDDRTLEKAARNELGMARHGELIFVFDHYIEDGE